MAGFFRSSFLKAVGCFLLAWTVVPSAPGRAESAEEQPAAAPSYFRDIRPVIQQHCQGCHQPAIKQGHLDLTRYRTLLQGGHSGPGLVPGDPEGSLLIAMMEGRRPPLMPLGGPPLDPEIIGKFRAWVEGGATDDTPIQLGRVSQKEPPVYTSPPVITALAYSPDGSLLAVSGYREVLLHRPDGTGLEGRLVGLSDRIQSLAFTPDGKTLVAGGGTPARFGELQFWEVASRKLKRSVTVCRDTLFGVSLSPDGSQVAFGCSDSTVRIHEVASGRQVLKTNHHENWVLGTRFGMDGKRVVSVGRDFAAKLMHAESGAFIENLNALKKELAAVTRHPSRDRVVVGGEERIPYYYRMDRPNKIFAGQEGTLIRAFERQSGEIFALEFSADGKKLAVAGAGSEATIYDVESGQRLAACAGHEAGIYTLAFHPGGRELATAGFEGRVRIHEVASGKLLRDFVPVPMETEMAASGR